MKIAYKLPMSTELSTQLLGMSDAAAGAVLKAVLVYQAGGEASALPPVALGAYEDMRGMMELSRKRARAGKEGGRSGGKGHFAPGKRDFAPSKTEFAPSKTLEPLPEVPQAPAQDDLDLLAGLDAFL